MRLMAAQLGRVCGRISRWESFHRDVSEPPGSRRAGPAAHRPCASHLAEDAARPPRSFLCSPTARGQPVRTCLLASLVGEAACFQAVRLYLGCPWNGGHGRGPGPAPAVVSAVLGGCEGLPLSPCCCSSGQVGLAALCSETITRQVGWSWADRIGIPSRAWDGGSGASAPVIQEAPAEAVRSALTRAAALLLTGQQAVRLCAE